MLTAEEVVQYHETGQVTSALRLDLNIISAIEEKMEALFRRESFPYAVGLFLIPHPNELLPGQERPDIFAPAYQDWVEELVADVCSRYTDDPMMMGYLLWFRHLHPPAELDRLNTVARQRSARAGEYPQNGGSPVPHGPRCDRSA